MNFLSRLGYRFSTGFSPRPVFVSSIVFNPVSKKWNFRNYSLPAQQEDGEEELEMIDQRKLPTDYDPANFDPTEHRSPPTDRVFRLVDEIAGLTLAESAELSSILREKMKINELFVGYMKGGAGSFAATAKAPGAAVEEMKPEKTVFELVLEAFDAASKIKIIKEVRTFTALGLKEAKELVEKAPGAVIKTGVSKEEAGQIIEKMEAMGAKVVMK